ncbi:Bgt-50203 [Blumeria graminis f. sp. tritici]|uniref:Bgt-50203 n=1 Tax=Blumeria graminis f. sp. tritici TaxID=62690 RepID=A0A9X9MFG5_BLUGR|nr:Bgt-50203 [Blumeria graminis f. sp. tritici]
MGGRESGRRVRETVRYKCKESKIHPTV